MTKLCAGATGSATVFFGWTVFLLPKLRMEPLLFFGWAVFLLPKLKDFFCEAAVLVFFPTEGNFRALFTLKAFMLSFGVLFGRCRRCVWGLVRGLCFDLDGLRVVLRQSARSLNALPRLGPGWLPETVIAMAVTLV